jgi:pimeloyl-ACP methyl ester carboxylesterase
VIILAAGATDLDVVQVGQGGDLVLLHSFLTDRTVFDPVIAQLGRGRRLTLVNLPGFGASAPAGPAIEDYADRVALLFSALRLRPETTDLLAMSFGGFVGIALAARHGHLFRRLVLVDTAAAFPEPAKAPLRAMAERAHRDGMGAVVETAIGRMFTEAFITAHPDIVAARSETLQRARPEHFATACRALADLDLRPVLGKIRNPTLVVVGALDATTPPALAHELAAGIECARLLEIPDCAHCPPLEKPDEFGRAADDFLAGGREAWSVVRHLALDSWCWIRCTVRDLAVSSFLNVLGFFLIFGFAAILAGGVRAGMERVLGWELVWPALAFALVAAGVWGTLFGLLTKEWIRNRDGKVLPLPALGVLVGGAAVWVYIFAAVSYVLTLLGFVHYEASGKPEDLIYKLTDAYAWHFLDLLPGLNITTALEWKNPVDLQGGWRGMLLVLFRAAVIFQVFAKGRQLLECDKPAGP